MQQKYFYGTIFMLICFIGIIFSGGFSPSVEKQKILHLYTWSGFLPDWVVKEFEEETNIKVIVDTFDSNDILEAKLFAGNSGYDIVFPTVRPYFQRMVQAKIFSPINSKSLNNLKYLDLELSEKLVGFSMDNTYGIPYLWGTTGIGFNMDILKKVFGEQKYEQFIKKPSWGMLFELENVTKLKPYGVSLCDSASDLVPTVMVYLGMDPNSNSLIDLGKAIDRLDLIRSCIMHFDSLQHLEYLAKGEICIAQSWSGEIRLARDIAKESENGVNIGYVVPLEGSATVCEVMAIPADAPHKENAHRFIDFVIRPQIIARISLDLKYANACKESTPYLTKEFLEDKVINPPREVLDILYNDSVQSIDFENHRNSQLGRVIFTY